MSKPAVVAAIAAALVLLCLGTYIADSSNPEESVPVTGGELRLHDAAGMAALRRPALPFAPTTDPSPAGRPYELDSLLRRSKLGEAWLAAHGFSSGTALQRLHALLNARTNIPGEAQFRLKAHPPGANEGETDGVPRLAADERYVMATLARASTSGEDSVLIRWRRISDDTVLELSAQALPAPGEPLQLWMRTRQDWIPGSYRLEVISATPALAPLAVAEFEIATRDATVTAFAYPVQASSPR